MGSAENFCLNEDVMDDNDQWDVRYFERHCILIDYGASRRCAQHGAAERVWFTPQGVAGRLWYRVPEIYRDQIFLGQEADMWTLGVLLVTMLVGDYEILLWREPAITPNNTPRNNENW